MTLEIVDTERDLLLRLLDGALGDLRIQVRRTSTPDFHDRLVEEERAVEALLSKIRSS